MFGKRPNSDTLTAPKPEALVKAPVAAATPATEVPKVVAPAQPRSMSSAVERVTKPARQATVEAAPVVRDTRTDEYYRVKSSIYNALIETIDLGQLAQLDQKTAREEIRDIVAEIIAIKQVVLSISEQEPF